MAIGDYERDADLLEGWNAFCEQVRLAGEQVFKDDNGATEVERCSGFNYLTQNLSQAFDIWLENRRTKQPFFHPFCSPIRKLGCDDADCIYFQSWINDHDTYRISGRRGSSRMLNFAVHGPWRPGYLHEPFGDFPFANVFGEDLDVDGDDHFELWISPDQHPGNWIESQPGTRKIFCRQYFDRWDEKPGAFRIERVGPPEPPAPLSVDTLLEAMGAAGSFVYDTVSYWPDALWDRYRIREQINQLVAQEADESKGVKPPHTDEIDAKRGRVVGHLAWELPRDSAMVIEFDPGDSFWQVTNMNVFGASLDFRYRQVNLTSGTSVRDSDQKVRLIMSHVDPGFANWIDTQEHGRGWMFFRNVRTRTLPEVRTRIVAMEDVGTDLEGVSPRITQAEREAEMRTRLAAYARRLPTLGV